MSLGLAIWLVLSSYRDVQYSDELWWEFAYSSDAPRSLRALVGAAVVFLIVGVKNVMRPQAQRPHLIQEDELERLQPSLKHRVKQTPAWPCWATNDLSSAKIAKHL